MFPCEIFPKHIYSRTPTWNSTLMQSSSRASTSWYCYIVIHVVIAIIPYVVTIDSLAVTVVDNVDAIDQLKPKILVASVIFSMAEYILFACSLWNLVTGVVIKPVVKILKIATLLIILLSVLSSSVVHDITSTLGVASLLPYHDSYKKNQNAIFVSPCIIHDGAQFWLSIFQKGDSFSELPSMLLSFFAADIILHFSNFCFRYANISDFLPGMVLLHSTFGKVVDQCWRSLTDNNLTDMASQMVFHCHFWFLWFISSRNYNTFVGVIAFHFQVRSNMNEAMLSRAEKLAQDVLDSTTFHRDVERVFSFFQRFTVLFFIMPCLLWQAQISKYVSCIFFCIMPLLWWGVWFGLSVICTRMVCH